MRATPLAAALLIIAVAGCAGRQESGLEEHLCEIVR